MIRFTVDTNILIAYIGGEERIVDQIRGWRENGATLFISSITECELLSYPKLTSEEEIKIEYFLKDHVIAVPFDGIRARHAALIRRTTSPLKLPDAAIAAVALEMNTPLVTRNIRDFKNVLNLQLLKI